MILTSIAKIKVNKCSLAHYTDLGYDVKANDTLSIPIELLSKGSQYKIDCMCDSCGIVNEVVFKKYCTYKNDWGNYTCRKCSEQKRLDSREANKLAKSNRKI
jgi:hypothetical protein